MCLVDPGQRALTPRVGVDRGQLPVRRGLRGLREVDVRPAARAARADAGGACPRGPPSPCTRRTRSSARARAASRRPGARAGAGCRRPALRRASPAPRAPSRRATARRRRRPAAAAGSWDRSQAKRGPAALVAPWPLTAAWSAHARAAENDRSDGRRVPRCPARGRRDHHRGRHVDGRDRHRPCDLREGLRDRRRRRLRASGRGVRAPADGGLREPPRRPSHLRRRGRQRPSRASRCASTATVRPATPRPTPRTTTSAASTTTSCRTSGATPMTTTARR